MIRNITHILVAEDEEADCVFLQEAFGQTRHKCILHFVHNGAEALDYLEKRGEFKNAQRPHLIFLDIRMPLKDGFETLEAIKSNPKFNDIPVMMFSGSRADNDVTHSYRLNACAYICKPRNFKEMKAFADSVDAFWLSQVELGNY